MNDSHPKHDLRLPDGVVLLDSLGDLRPGNTSPILVCGSHCGGNRALAAHVQKCHVRVVFLNNAGVGKNQAGVRGLTHYEAENVLACAVDHQRAEIGVSRDTYESGIITHATPQARSVGIQVGDSVQEAIARLPGTWPQAQQDEAAEPEEAGSKEGLKKQAQAQVDGVAITVTDSITFLNEGNAGDVVVCGSHGGLSAGEYARKRRVKAAFFNDAGIGKNRAGVKGLELLNASGILACTVDCMSAEIFNGQDALDNGIVSVCNSLAESRGVQIEMTIKEAIRCIKD